MTRQQRICWSEVTASKPIPVAPPSGMIFGRPCRRGTPTRRRQMRETRYFHGCYSLGDNQLWGVTRLRKGGDHTLATLKSIRADECRNSQSIHVTYTLGV
jgi:hypothetical protein